MGNCGISKISHTATKRTPRVVYTDSNVKGTQKAVTYSVCNMLIGEYTHSFDEKNRISLPAKFRTEVGKKIVITRGLDACLFLYSGKAFEKFSAKLEDLSMGSVESRGFSRFLFGGAADVEVDSAGRILIPDFLRTFAKIEKSAIFVGVRERVEIWNEEMWTMYKAKIEQQGDSLAQKLGDIGFI